MKIIKEHFGSIHQMIAAIESRPNNAVMASCHSSDRKDYDFTLSQSYDEAKQLFETGYTDILDEIKTGVANNLKQTQTENRRRVHTNVVGYAPHVPNAIMGLPNAMIMTDSQPQKIKAVSVVVGVVENCGTNAKEFVKSGIAALGVVNTLELRGYRVKLQIAFYVADIGNENVFATVDLKDYREHLDLQKLCFPLAHPSMFRRLGFKWLETHPEITESGWAYYYGHSISDVSHIKKNFLGENEFYIDLKTTRNCGYDVDKLIAKMNLN